MKQADRLHNLSTLKDGPPAKWTREYLLAYLAHSLLLADRLRGLPALSERIRACVRSMRRSRSSIRKSIGSNFYFINISVWQSEHARAI